MKKSYAISLAVIVILLTVSLSLTTSYGLWKITSGNENVTDINGCFEIIMPDLENIKNSSLGPLNEENGKATEPYSLSIKNTCSSLKKAEVRLNIKEENTINIKGLTIYVQGDIDTIPTKYNELKNSRGDMSGLSQSKIITSAEIDAGATVRLNIKMWIDEKVVSNIKPEEALKAQFAITDKESIVLPTFKETILENNGGIEVINNNQKPSYASIEDTNANIYPYEDEDGISYYFRGVGANNYVSFANKTWRIVRINGDDTIRLILQDSVSESAFNEKNNKNYHAGFAYTEDNEIINSTVKTYLEDWYNDNLKSFDNYIAIANYCNDTQNYINNWHNYYQASARLVGSKEPNLICETNEENYGGKYRTRIGLITADEVALAGGVYKLANSNYYLNNGTSFYTMTPRDYYYSQTAMFIVRENGAMEETSSSNKKSIRPVINLKANTVVTGDGTIDNPYKIDEDANK